MYFIKSNKLKIVGSQNVNSELPISKFQKTEVWLQTSILKVQVFRYGTSK
ncbi:hypothetical protein C1645_819799 [Glomus cerebriforme]|uniref:Uncharacterized protein n=1 Tax=Glomus cerebriforme TaxID=658196 RepID=A0A397T5N8_9GLOM|nr:hypothetical protein C1645_819799 [Glomus cerebriforme]